MNEIWKDVIGYEGCYSVSNLGRVKSLKRKVNSLHGINTRTVNERIIAQRTTMHGYMSVALRKYGKDKTLTVHRLIAIAFLNNPDDKPEVNHLDGNKKNNKLYNLEWVTKSENIKHAFRTGLQSLEKLKQSGIKASLGNRKPITQYDKDMNVIRVFESCKDAAEATNIPHTNISQVCNGKCKRKSAGGFIWRYNN